MASRIACKAAGENSTANRRAGSVRASFAAGSVSLPIDPELEEPLRVGFGIPELPGQLRQTCADEGYGQLKLRAPMQRGDEDLELGLSHVLQLVDEEHHHCFAVPSGLPDDLKQTGEIRIESPGIRNTGLDP